MMWFILLCVTVIADGVLTYLILKQGGRELNAFMAQIMDKIGMMQTIVLSRALLLIIGYTITQLAMPLAIIFAVVSAWNLIQYIKGRK
jgi:hypothetical protein